MMKELRYSGILFILFIITSACDNEELKVSQVNEQLYSKWELVSLNNEFADTLNFGQTPYLLFSKEENKINGYAGCNNIFGGFTVDENLIKFQQIGSTMMACPELEFENSFLQSLQKVTNYVIIDDTLKLYFEKQILIEFKKTK